MSASSSSSEVDARRARYLREHTGDRGRRENRHQQAISLRKAQRSRMLSMKRVCEDDIEELELSEDEAATRVSDLVSKLLAAGASDDNAANRSLQHLRRFFARGSLFVELFLSSESSVHGDEKYPAAVMSLLLRHLGRPSTQLEAAWVFTNMAASHVPEHTRAAMTASPQLILLLQSTNILLQAQSAWALGNIAADGPETRDILLSQGIVGPLMELVPSSDIKVTQQAAFCLSHILRGPGAPVGPLLEHENLAPRLLRALEVHGISSEAGGVGSGEAATTPMMAVTTTDASARVGDVRQQQHSGDWSSACVTELFWCMTYATARAPFLPSFIEGGLMQVSVLCLAASLRRNDWANAAPIVRVMGNLACGPDELALLLISITDISPPQYDGGSGAFGGGVTTTTTTTDTTAATTTSLPLELLRHCLTAPARGVKLEAVWVLSSLAASGPIPGGAVLASGVVPPLVSILGTGSHDAQRETAHALLNIGCHSSEAMNTLLEAGAPQPFLGLVRSPDPGLRLAALQFVELVCRLLPYGVEALAERDVVDILEGQQYGEDAAVSRLATELLDKYFMGGEMEETVEPLHIAEGHDGGGVGAAYGGAANDGGSGDVMMGGSLPVGGYNF